jgi:hypothetical protein
MTPLPDQFRHDGFDFRLLKRIGDVVLLVKSKPGGTPSYEVVKLIRAPDREMFGRIIPAHEAMPPSEAWGQRGWTYCDRDRADTKFAALTSIDSGARPPRFTIAEGQKRHDHPPQAVLTLPSEVLP